ncbi:MAG: amidohydrolase family protein, partial [Candidatus Ornithospirochaeta sp.]
KYVLEKKIMPLEEAVRRMTGETASRFSIKDRGRVEEGMRADITVFDPKALSEDGERKNKGFKLVMVNGKVALIDDKVQYTGSGRVLRV